MIWNKLFGKKNTESEIDDNNIIDEIQETDDTNKENKRDISNDISEKLFQFDDNLENIQEINVSLTKSKSRFIKFLDGLKKSRSQVTHTLGNIFSGGAVSIQMLDALEDILLQADLGTEISAMLRQKLEKEKFGKNISENEIKQFLAIQIQSLLSPVQGILTLKREAKPNVILFVGVNGSGKTTTIGKFAKHFKQSELSVMLAAGDTFRAAAVEQLTIWGERNQVPVFSKPQGSDAAGLVYDAYAKALEDKVDILLIDTAGRLQNKHNLMQELLKIVRVLQKYDSSLPHEIIMVLDATTGQNALRQAEVFRDMADISGIIVTKLDGTAKGGILVPIGHKMKLPVYAIGIGENVQDLKLFSAKDYANALIGYQEAENSDK
jgi:fused signal recognition particle receptor